MFEARGAAGHALQLLTRARAAAARLRRKAFSPEDLHEFRVSLRRLIVYLKAHGKTLGAPKKLRRRLRRVLRSSGPLRDAQVELAWLGRHVQEAKRQDIDASPLVAAAQARELPRLDRSLLAEFGRLAVRLSRLCEGAGKAAFDEERFRRRAARKASRRTRKLAARLRGLGEDPRARDIHKARIAVKNLRYVLEPVEDVSGLPALKRVKELQTLLGDAHDRDALVARVQALARRRPRLEALAAGAVLAAEGEKKRLLAQVRRLWRGKAWNGY